MKRRDFLVSSVLCATSSVFAQPGGGCPALLCNTHGGVAPDCPAALERTPKEFLAYVTKRFD